GAGRRAGAAAAGDAVADLPVDGQDVAVERRGQRRQRQVALSGLELQLIGRQSRLLGRDRVRPRDGLAVQAVLRLGDGVVRLVDRALAAELVSGDLVLVLHDLLPVAVDRGGVLRELLIVGADVRVDRRAVVGSRRWLAGAVRQPALVGQQLLLVAGLGALVV